MIYTPRAMFLARATQEAAAAKAGNKAKHQAPDAGHVAAMGRGRELDPSVRGRLQAALGHRLGSVQIHTDSAADAFARGQSARAITLGEHIAFAAGEYRPNTMVGDALLAHELAHTIEQQDGSLRSPLTTESSESQSDAAALAATGRLRGSSAAAPSIFGGGLALRRCSNERSRVRTMLNSGRALTAAEARQALDVYRGMSASERNDFFTRHNAAGGVRRVMTALPATDAATTYRLEVQDILRRVQQAATQLAAGTDDAGLAAAQAALMQAQAATAVHNAQVAAGLPAAPPTAAELQAARQTSVEATTPVRPFVAPQTWYEALPTDVDRRAWDTRAGVAIANVVNFASTHPAARELRLTAADFAWEPNGVARRGANVLALGRVLPNRRTILVGREWLLAAEAAPAYGLSIAVHEARGHWEYGESESTYPMELYNRARVQVPGAAAAPSRAEIDQFGYWDTEIYSLLRSLPSHTPLAAGHVAQVPAYVDPAATIRHYIRTVQTDWAVGVWPALIRGLYVRLSMDPRIAPVALAAFVSAVTAEVAEPHRSMILAPP